MKRALRVGMFVFAVFGLLGSISFAYPAWTQEVGLDFWNLPALEEELADQVRIEHELEHEGEQVQRSVLMRCTLADDLIEERITAEDAIAEFLALNEGDPERESAVRTFFPSPSLEESTRKQLLAFVEARMLDACAKNTEVLPRVRRQIASARLPQLDATR